MFSCENSFITSFLTNHMMADLGIDSTLKRQFAISFNITYTEHNHSIIYATQTLKL